MNDHRIALLQAENERLKRFQTRYKKAWVAGWRVPMQQIAEIVLDGELLEVARARGQSDLQEKEQPAGTIYKLSPDLAYDLLHVVVWSARTAIKINADLERKAVEAGT